MKIANGGTNQVLEDVVPSHKVCLAVQFDNSNSSLVLGNRKHTFCSCPWRLFGSQYFASLPQILLSSLCVEKNNHFKSKRNRKKKKKKCLPMSQLHSTREALTSLIGALVLCLSCLMRLIWSTPAGASELKLLNKFPKPPTGLLYWDRLSNLLEYSFPQLNLRLAL